MPAAMISPCYDCYYAGDSYKRLPRYYTDMLRWLRHARLYNNTPHNITPGVLSDTRHACFFFSRF